MIRNEGLPVHGEDMTVHGPHPRHRLVVQVENLKIELDTFYFWPQNLKILVLICWPQNLNDVIFRYLAYIIIWG